MNVRAAARKAGLSPRTIYARMEGGMTLEQALEAVDRRTREHRGRKPVSRGYVASPDEWRDERNVPLRNQLLRGWMTL